MFYKFLSKKLLITTLSILVALLIYLFPNNSTKPGKIIKNNKPNTVIYLLDNYNFLSQTNIYLQSDSTINLAKSIINNLTINNNNHYTSDIFTKIIPENTKLLSISLDNKILKLNFSKELLNISKELENTLIESLIYSLCSLDNVDSIMLFIENNHLDSLPHNNKLLPPVLNKEYGINKIYDISNINNINSTTIMYLTKNDNYTYYTPVTYINNNNDEKIKIIIEKLKSSSLIYPNLMSYLSASIELEEYEILENTIRLSFNEYIFNDLKNQTILEEVKYILKETINANYDLDKLIIIVNNKEIDHISLKNLE